MRSRLPSSSCQHSLERWCYDPRLCVGLCFSSAKWETHRTKYLFATRVLCCSLWLTGFISRRSRTLPFGGSCLSTSNRETQQLRHRTFSPGKELQEVDEHWGRGTCSPRGNWFVLVAVSEYWLIQAVILNIHMICNNCVLTWRTFFFQLQDDEKQCQHSRSWIKNKRTVYSTD